MEVRDRILIIEDDRSIRKFFRTILEANRYDVISADTGEEGYSLITSQCPDLVILDLGLPDRDGTSGYRWYGNFEQTSEMVGHAGRCDFCAEP